MNSPHLEEWAALHAAGLLDESETRALLQAADKDAEVQRMIEEFRETAALLVYDAPLVAPPPALKRELMRQLSDRRSSAKVIPFTSWIPFALAACLMGLSIYQAVQISQLDGQLRSSHGELVALRNRNDMAEMKLAMLEAKDASYAGARVMIAWDPKMHHGMVSMHDMPAPPPGHEYQLWVLDPSAPAPLNAGMIRPGASSEAFAVRPVSGSGPGFAISLEPSGGRPTPTGAILFAVAPGD
jgi:anti-sigma-K factor RskA